MCFHCPTLGCPHWHLLLAHSPLSTPQECARTLPCGILGFYETLKGQHRSSLLITLTLMSNGFLPQVCRELGFSELLSLLHSSDVGAPSCPGCSSLQPVQRLCSTCRSSASCSGCHRPLPHCLHSILPPNKGTLLSRHCMIVAKSYMCGPAGGTGVAAQVHDLLLDSCGSRRALASVKSAVLPSRIAKDLRKKTQKVG